MPAVLPMGSQTMVDPSETTPLSRYHHFVPQFILRNFAHSYNPKSGKGRKKKGMKGLYRGDKVVYAVNLTDENIEIIESRVTKTFGIQDLYLDVQHPTNQQHVEEMFSKLEARAAEIMSKIRKSFEAGDKEVALRRTERDIIRKFVFIMKYRGTTFRKRFAVNSVDDYVSDDKEQFVRYMKKKGFSKPIEVWLDNIQAFLETKMDVDSDWKDDLMKRAYPLDASWFWLITDWYYMSFCTPLESDDEFMMTENGYGIFEGPVSRTTNIETGVEEKTSYTEYHIFSHISPKLTMVLRANILPLAVEDVQEDVRVLREAMLKVTQMPHHQPETATSFLADLPVTKPRNSYTKFVDGVPRPITGQMPVFGPNDIFYFRFFPLSPEHVGKINMVFLEEAYTTTMIAFKTKIGFRRALEFYLNFQDFEKDGLRNFKQVSREEDGVRRIYLHKLEEIVQQLGGNTTAIYREVDPELEEVITYSVKYMPDQVQDMIRNDEKMISIYTKLCAKTKLDPEDFGQAKIMLKLRIKIDTWTKGLPESYREKVREDLRDFYCQLPAQRLWIYLKRLRFMFRGCTILDPWMEVVDEPFQQDDLHGPEDTIAISRNMFLTNRFRHIMYHATTNHLRQTDSGFGLKTGLTLDDDSIKRLRQDHALAFGAQGSICNCGIRDFQDIAGNLKLEFIANPPSFGEMDSILDQILTDEERLEMSIRGAMSEDLCTAIDPNARTEDAREMQELMEVLFEVVYPVFGFKRGRDLVSG